MGKEQMFCFSIDKDKWSNYNGTYNNKKTRPQTVLEHLGRALRCIAETTHQYYCIFLSFMSSVSAIIPFFTIGLFRLIFLLPKGNRLIKCTLTTE